MIVTKNLRLETRGNTDIIDITRDVAHALEDSRLKAGIVTVFVAHSTAGIAVMEFESGLIQDFKRMFGRVIPAGVDYEHDRGSGEGNGHAHVRASLLGPSVIVPFNQGSLLLGTWQQVVLIDFDNRPRSREVIVQVMGE